MRAVSGAAAPDGARLGILDDAARQARRDAQGDAAQQERGAPGRAEHGRKVTCRLVGEALKIFYDMRKVPGLKKKPSTSELLDWLKLLVTDDIDPETLRQRDPTKLIPPLAGALLKNEADMMLFERLAFLARREQRGGTSGST